MWYNQFANVQFVQDNANEPRGNPKCIVLCPTRELAKQVEKEFQESAPALRLACVYGGIPALLNPNAHSADPSSSSTARKVI